jgi:RNA polymerase sigma factor (sigma-70 family)
MKLPAAGRTTVWATAISVSALAPHAAPVALGLAVAKEGFDLLHARVHKATVLSYIRAAGAGTYLSVDPSGAAPGVNLQTASPSARPRGEGEGAVQVPADDAPGHAGADPDPGEFCIKHRAEWLSYARAHARNSQDAEDAVSHVAEKILVRHARTGTLCPPGYDPEAWSKTVIANYIKDLHRRAEVRVKYQGKLHSPPGDFVEDLVDELLARQAFLFIKSLRPGDHQIAQMRYAEGLEPSVIAERLGRNVVTVRTSLLRTKLRARRHLGIDDVSQVLIPRQETT